MTRSSLLALAALPAFAHMVSMSTGEIRIEGARARYELRMPLYEVAHIKDPQRSLFEHITFRSRGAGARLVEKSCREDAAEGAYICAGTYEFPAPVDRLEAECTFHSITVPNHVHLLRAARGEKTDQAVFDFSFPRAEIRFDPPTVLETALREGGAGLLRAVGGAAQILFAASLVLAARSRRELLALAGAFVAGEIASAVLVPLTGWQPAPRFVEAAAALTIAYLAIEILLLPEAGNRWLVVGVLGVFHGLYFMLFLKTSGYQAGYVLAGVAVGELLLIALFALVLPRLGRVFAELRPVQVTASLLFVVGIVWFFLRLRS